MIVALYAVSWTEFERGWGCRPDGFSLHRTALEGAKFVADVQSQQPTDHVPHEYSAPDGEPFLMEVSQSLYDLVTEFGDVWLWAKSEEQYKTFDATEIIQRKKAEAAAKG
jgi:hypothetical protein